MRREGSDAMALPADNRIGRAFRNRGFKRWVAFRTLDQGTDRQAGMADDPQSFVFDVGDVAIGVELEDATTRAERPCG